MADVSTVDVVEQLAGSLRAATEQLDLSAGFRPRGVIRRVGDGVAFIVGLEDIGYEELLVLDSGVFGLAYDLGPRGTGAVLLSGADDAKAGEGVTGLGCLPSLPVGPETLGRIIDPLGNPLDDGPPLADSVRLPLFRPAPEFIDRKGVDEPLLTGVMVVDAAIPIGRGQRELIIGDRNTGKSALALDMVTATSDGRLDDIDPETASATVEKLLRRSRAEAAAVMLSIDNGILPDQWKEQLAVTVRPDPKGVR